MDDASTIIVTVTVDGERPYEYAVTVSDYHEIPRACQALAHVLIETSYYMNELYSLDMACADAQVC